MKLFFSAGEPSGDLHAASLIQALSKQKEVECRGYGGPHMEEAGCKIDFELTQLALMGIIPVLMNIHRFYAVHRQTKQILKEFRPDAVILVDFPGFNWWVAKAAKAEGIPVYFYCPPQIWGWAGWRIKKMQRLVDHVLCPLPFEKQFFEESGLNTHYVGHPFFEDISDRQLDESFLETLQEDDRPVLGVFPGSRRLEVLRNTKAFEKTIRELKNKYPNVKAVVGCYNHRLENMFREELSEDHLFDEIHVGKTPEIMQAAHCCLAVSGSISLELMHHLKPTVIHYKITRFQYVLQSIFRRVKYVTLVNLLATKELHPKDVTLFEPTQPDADQVPYPEYVTIQDRSRDLVAHLLKWLTNQDEHRRKVTQLKELKTKFGLPGASDNAAKAILETLNQPKADTLKGPHFKENAKVSEQAK
ncbi:Lipid-A-disaccharide synthase [Planctomycetales bacterium 10988]|nr:Lipid-A-disaccharide synthase [Planctomycetales bacterium 10988]